MTTLRSVIAYLASMIRCAGVVYIVVQAVTWHSFYAIAPWRLAAPALAVAWAVAGVVFLRRRWPPAWLACADSAVYLALALCAQACVPPGVRDAPFSWMVISMSGQLIVPAWYAPGVLSTALALLAPAAYAVGAVLQPVTDARTLAGATALLLVVGLVHLYGRRALYRGAAAADAGLDRADEADREQYAILRASIERREHDRLLHDTVLNTLTALSRDSRDSRVGAGPGVSGVADACRRNVALIESALGDRDDGAAGGSRPAADLLREMGAVVAEMRARGLTVHADFDDGGGAVVPSGVVTAITNAAREALVNVAAHAGTEQAWVAARVGAPGDGVTVSCGLEVIVRDEGTGFDPARVDSARLGLRRSIAERAADCGGQASIWSAPGRGTVVSLSWPAGWRPGQGEPSS